MVLFTKNLSSVTEKKGLNTKFWKLSTIMMDKDLWKKKKRLSISYSAHCKAMRFCIHSSDLKPMIMTDCMHVTSTLMKSVHNKNTTGLTAYPFPHLFQNKNITGPIGYSFLPLFQNKNITGLVGYSFLPLFQNKNITGLVGSSFLLKTPTMGAFAWKGVTCDVVKKTNNWSLSIMVTYKVTGNGATDFLTNPIIQVSVVISDS